MGKGNDDYDFLIICAIQFHRSGSVCVFVFIPSAVCVDTLLLEGPETPIEASFSELEHI